MEGGGKNDLGHATLWRGFFFVAAIAVQEGRGGQARQPDAVRGSHLRPNLPLIPASSLSASHLILLPHSPQSSYPPGHPCFCCCSFHSLPFHHRRIRAPDLLSSPPPPALSLSLILSPRHTKSESGRSLTTTCLPLHHLPSIHAHFLISSFGFAFPIHSSFHSSPFFAMSLFSAELMHEWRAALPFHSSSVVGSSGTASTSRYSCFSQGLGFSAAC